MTRKQAKAIQARWKKMIAPDCTHVHLELEDTQKRYLTGSYFCKACGSQIRNGKAVDPPSRPTRSR